MAPRLGYSPKFPTQNKSTPGHFGNYVEDEDAAKRKSGTAKKRPAKRLDKTLPQSTLQKAAQRRMSK
jgi:hypothetical protein